MNQPNIIYLHAHDLGRFCEPFGYAIPSPNLQRFVESGVLFRKAFCAAPTCSPSRAALVTGRYPHCNGMFGLASTKWNYTLNDYSQHIAHFFRGQGYETALSGVQHVARPPRAEPKEVLPYDHFLNHTPTDRQTHDHPNSAEAAAEYLGRKHDKPFFLSVGFIEPHRSGPGEDRRELFAEVPYEPPEDLDDRYCLPLPIYPDTPVTRRETANFKEGVKVMDRKFGVVLDAIEKNNLAENTIVICTTDHGPGFPDMKRTLSDRGTGVMLAIRGPEFTGGKVCDAMVTHMDLFPTLCDTLGVEKPDWLQGESILPLMRGETESIHDVIFTEQSWHGDYCPLRAVQSERYKYIKRFDVNAKRGIDRGPTQVLWEEHGWQEMPQDEEEFYDLLFDPNERNNLVGNERYKDALEDMRTRLQDWLEATDDPILTDSIPKPLMLDSSAL